ncbi:MAG: hypothetical protein ACRDXB_01580, partial [Actinomycetes bacterium]
MNRRGNGLSADTYAPLVDLAPHLADAMLTALGDAGVAAYAASPSDLADLADLVEPAGEPVAGDVLDRLYVDVDMKPAAEGILRAHLARLRDASARDASGRGPDADRPEPAEPDTPPKETGASTELDEDAIWAEIVAGFDSTPDGEDVPWPDEENLREPDDPPKEG